MCQPIQNLIYNKNGVTINFIETKNSFRFEFVYDRSEAEGTIVLTDSAYGLDIICPEIDANIPVALLDLFYSSEEARVFKGQPPVQIVLYSPPQTDDPLGRVRLFPKGSQVDFEQGVQEIVPGPALHLKAFGYPPGMTAIDIE